MIQLMLGSLIHGFHWELDGQTPPEKMDIEEKKLNIFELFLYTTTSFSFTHLWDPLQSCNQAPFGADVKGHDLEPIPFGALVCHLRIRMIPLMLGSLIHEFNWELEGRVLPEKMDMEERFGFTFEKAERLQAIPTQDTAPGPPPIPTFGNLFNLGSKPHISLAQLAKTYGPLMIHNLGQVPTVIISSAAVALQKNGLSFSNRNVADAVRALDHHQHSVVWLPVSPQWRSLRELCNSLVFSARSLKATRALRKNKVKDLLSYVQKCSEAGIAVNIGQAAFTASLNLLSNTLFSVDLGDPRSQLSGEFRKTVQGVMEEAGKPNFTDYLRLLGKMDPPGIRHRMTHH
ncbi:hypothetical protein Cgig2_002470 [Carnegiea gigantea]|uniref:Uncharacterized protein n=1 Tax=Carnegiea gigantea TaxID=171969 RepID=A0A9Q1QNJ8_9CARY|nr:hypothetical protein Cgig2_002470 [Carnegiea gigantea]